MLTARTSRLPTVMLALSRLVLGIAATLLAAATLAGPTAEVAAAARATDGGACGDKACGPVAGNPTPCGDKACGPVAGNPTPCGDKACGPVAGNPLPCPACGGPATNGNPNQPGASPAQATPSSQPSVGPGQNPSADSGTTTTAAGFQAPGQAAPLFNPRKTSGSSSGWVLPVVLVGLVALVFFWLVRRQRRRIENPS